MSVNVVTGASGFIGKKLIQRLATDPDNRIIAVVRNDRSNRTGIDHLNNVDIILCEMNDIKSLPERLHHEKVDRFFHLAWEGSTGVRRADHEIQMQNMLWTIDAFHAAEAMNCDTFFCAGTISEKVLEQVDGLNSISQNMVYAQAKKSTYEFLKIISKNSKVKLVWMQFSNVYGADNNSGNLISYTLKELEEGRVPEYGSGSQPYNFVHIDDLISGICCLENSTLSKDIYFIGSDEVMLLKEYLEQIPKAMGLDVKLGIGKRPDDGVKYEREWFSISDIKTDTGYDNKYSFFEGISAMRKKQDGE